MCLSAPLSMISSSRLIDTQKSCHQRAGQRARYNFFGQDLRSQFQLLHRLLCLGKILLRFVIPQLPDSIGFQIRLLLAERL